MAKSPQSETSFTPYAAPDFALPSSDGTVVTSKGLHGHWTVLFFYPTDDTETCTKECLAFSETVSDFEQLGVKLYGVSKDDLKSHDKFIRKYGLKMPLLSDEDTAVITAFGSWIEKKLYGREYMGTDRSTFIIDPEGQVRKVWRAVRVKNHATDVLAAVQSLIGA